MVRFYHFHCLFLEQINYLWLKLAQMFDPGHQFLGSLSAGLAISGGRGFSTDCRIIHYQYLRRLNITGNLGIRDPFPSEC